MIDIPGWLWAATIVFIVALFAFDLVVAVRRPHAVHLREATFWSVFYIAVAVGFGFVLWAVSGHEAGTEYFAGWVVEKSLSVDNLFVFVIIFARFSVPQEYQQKVLLFGIAGALILRTVLIAIGSAAVSAFSWTFLFFGLVLLWTAIQLIRHRNDEPDVDDNFLVRNARKVLPVTDDFHGGRLLTHENGRRVVTPLLLVFIAIGSTDVLFALDSIPAVFGVTSEPFIVFTANAFALLGLRALFFLVEGLLERLVYLSIGLSVILAFIAVKLLLHFAHEDVSTSVPEIPTPLSLSVILGILAVTAVASLLRVRAHPEEKARAHAVTIRSRTHETEQTETEAAK
ncbi:tellurite resistance protein TerC [Thermomonospora echinospora]|uniref:Tellurite resistance protein TerC n=1 Tax=Thermomonospora echinospora TaxID=1992 RepID=A0A1H6DN01_9ACTN|nr:TerC family protein [Thermomonospora echinospora]SEG85975.1 tellurite resistance protein TerC [Thermomonospora echinospora]